MILVGAWHRVEGEGRCSPHLLMVSPHPQNLPFHSLSTTPRGEMDTISPSSSAGEQRFIPGLSRVLPFSAPTVQGLLELLSSSAGSAHQAGSAQPDGNSL